MTLLVVYGESDPQRPLSSTRAPEEIATQLSTHGVRFEQWSCPVELSAAATQDEILTAYRADVGRLQAAFGYASADVVRLKRAPADPDWPAKARAAREKFLDEHRHAEDEVRFFVEGTGLFVLRLAAQLYFVLCERGDLLSVPAGTRHWFDMGSEPSFCAIRLFVSPAGWAADFTGEPIARRFPGYDELASRWR